MPSVPQGDGFNGNDPVIDDASALELPTAHGGAIAAAIGSEYAVPARSAELESDTMGAGRGVRGETDGGESPIAYIDSSRDRV